MEGLNLPHTLQDSIPYKHRITTRVVALMSGWEGIQPDRTSLCLPPYIDIEGKGVAGRLNWSAGGFTADHTFTAAYALP